MSSEEEIEDLIASNPWILDEYYELVHLKGKNGRLGRQIKLHGKYLDILLFDRRSKRPVIVEVKKNKAQRNDIGQLAEYYSIFTLGSDKKLRKAIGRFYPERSKNDAMSVPKLILLCKAYDEDIKNACNLMGIEIRAFGSEREFRKLVRELGEKYESLKRAEGINDELRMKKTPKIECDMEKIIKKIDRKATVYFPDEHGFTAEFEFYLKHSEDCDLTWYVSEFNPDDSKFDGLLHIHGVEIKKNEEACRKAVSKLVKNKVLVPDDDFDYYTSEDAEEYDTEKSEIARIWIDLDNKKEFFADDERIRRKASNNFEKAIKKIKAFELEFYKQL